MTVGDRRIVGQIKPRIEARKIYEAARAAGHITSLLDQERPNIFTQSVANIEPGEQSCFEATSRLDPSSGKSMYARPPSRPRTRS